jgi:hypothetical protein
MATLVLSAVGHAIGGPIGGAIGSILGQQIDHAVFAPKARHGPRLGDLSVQTSSYGAAIPKIFGRVRVAGNVIWSTDLIESRSSSGGGKGRPKTVTYSYSASFAVALSARPVRRVGRIWADGKLLRGAAGDFKTATEFRLHPGDEDQAVDPLVASAVGAGQTPAFRGIAYAVFENFQLEDYGNRIPSLTFEVEADIAAPAIGVIAEELGEGAISAGPTPAVEGYAASGDSVRSALAALVEAVPLSLCDREGSLRLTTGSSDAILLAREEESGRREIIQRPVGGVPSAVSLSYYDVARDFQAGLQRANRTGGAGAEERRSLAATLSAANAKGFAEHLLETLWAGRATATVGIGWQRSSIKPGDRVRMTGDSRLWKVQRLTIGVLTVALDLVGVPAAEFSSPAGAEAGGGAGQPDLPLGSTILRLFELPLGDSVGGRPLLYAAAAGTESGWRRTALSASFGGSADWQTAGATAAPSVLGTITEALPAAGSTLFDQANSLEVTLLNESLWLEGRSDQALAAGANLALAGRELIQFGIAEPLGDRKFRLSRLLRGRRGTEWAAPLHEPGEDFVLLEQGSLVRLEAPADSIGASARVSASDGLSSQVVAERRIEGETVRPPSPVHLRARRLAEGDVLVSWVRRSREGWNWAGGAETPLAEEEEAYRLVIAGSGFERTVRSIVPGHLYTAARQADDGVSGPIGFSVRQIGTFADSRPASIMLT